MKKDAENETIGIIAIIIIVSLAAIGLYFLFLHQPPTALKGKGNNPSIPVEAPSPINSNQGQNEFKILPASQMVNNAPYNS